MFIFYLFFIKKSTSLCLKNCPKGFFKDSSGVCTYCLDNK